MKENSASSKGIVEDPKNHPQSSFDAVSVPCLLLQLDAARRQAFTGRQAELAAFDEALQGSSRRVLLVHGDRGIGKSTLIKEFVRRAKVSGRPVFELRGSSGFAAVRRLRERLWQLGLGVRPGEPGIRLDPLLAPGTGPVLLIDDADHVEDWLRAELLPWVPESFVVVVATTAPPHVEWSSDHGWRGLVRLLRLEALPIDDGMELLAQLDVESSERSRLWKLAEGHPLALTLFAQQHQREGLKDLARSPALVDALLQRLVGRVRDQACVEALFVCAHAAVTTEDLLRHVLERTEVSQIWAWLCTLGAVRRDPTGLCLSQPVRRLIDADMRHRSPDRYQTLHTRVHEYAWTRLQADIATHSPVGEIGSLFAGHRASALTAVCRLAETEGTRSRRGLADDHPAALEFFLRAGGRAEAALAREWLHRQPESLYITETDGEVVAAAVNVAISPDAAPWNEDPVVREVMGRLGDAGLRRPNDTVHVLRFVADRSGDRHSTAAVFTGVTAAAVGWLTGSPSWGFAVVPADNRWRHVLGDLAMSPVPVPAIDGDPVFELDFRRLPPEGWLAFMVQRELRGDSGPPPAVLLCPAPLGYTQFAEALRAALRSLHRPDELAGNPLTGSSLAADCDLPVGEALRNRIISAISSLGTGQKDQMLVRVLETTYVRPESNQKTAARMLGLPFSTYRRYLVQGVDRVVNLLWLAESGQDRSAGPAGVWGQGGPPAPFSRADLPG